jgi:erythromycin esterase-like protein
MARRPDPTDERALADELRRSVVPLTGDEGDFDELLALLSGARFVLIGEASHGTHEFYRVRAEITKRLIEEQGFRAIAAEADWPDAYRVNRYVRAIGEDADASEALSDFARFPQWMWRNADVLDFVGWLREHNDGTRDPRLKAGFYGLDLYSLHGSIDAVLRTLSVADPEAARRAQERYGCFDFFGLDPQAYGYATTLGLSPGCEEEALEQLVELRREAGRLAERDGRLGPDERFFAEQNARVVANAERYYRTMFGGRASSWNLRDEHMVETLEALVGHLGETGPPAKVVVWAHNSHLGDARATGMGARGERNVGELVRRRHGNEARLVGLTTHSGFVSAASDWGAPVERKRVRPALAGSWEGLFHSLDVPNFFFDLRAGRNTSGALREPRLERAIGVVYRPETERQSHYFQADLAAQFDCVLHYDTTRAVEPLERTAPWEAGELPETYPSAL